MRWFPAVLLSALYCGTVLAGDHKATDTATGAAVPLAARTGPAPQVFFDHLQLHGAHSHELTDAEHRRLAVALARLPPLQRQVLDGHLDRISFVEGMPNNALTYPVGMDPATKRYDIAIRAGVLNETVSELVTRKERSCFDARGSALQVSIDAGTMDALT